MPQQEARAYRHSASCKYPIRFTITHWNMFIVRAIAELSNSQADATSSISLSYRKLISWKTRNPTCRMISPTCWRRRRGLSSSWLPTSPFAKSPLSWAQTSPWPPSLLPTPATPLQCPPSHRSPSLIHPLSLPASRPSPQPPTPYSPAPAPPSPQPLSLAAQSRCQTWSPLSWRSLWISWQRRRWRRHGLCQRSTCPAPSTRVRSGRLFTPQLIPMTSSPCAHL